MRLYGNAVASAVGPVAWSHENVGTLAHAVVLSEDESLLQRRFGLMGFMNAARHGGEELTGT